MVSVAELAENLDMDLTPETLAYGFAQSGIDILLKENIGSDVLEQAAKKAIRTQKAVRQYEQRIRRESERTSRKYHERKASKDN